MGFIPLLGAVDYPDHQHWVPMKLGVPTSVQARLTSASEGRAPVVGLQARQRQGTCLAQVRPFKINHVTPMINVVWSQARRRSGAILFYLGLLSSSRRATHHPMHRRSREILREHVKLLHPLGAGAMSSTYCPDQAVLTSILRGCTCAALGMRSFSTPFLNSADVFSVSSSRDRLNTRR